jgi:hypothetical protein
MTDEIALLRQYGPDAGAATDEGLSRARRQLVARIGSADPRRHHHPGRRVLILGAAGAAVAAIGAVTLPNVFKADRTPQSPIVLADFATPVFPLDLRPRPADLSAPTFTTGDTTMLTAVYRSQSHGNDVYVGVSARRPDLGTGTPVTLDGKPATLSILAGGDVRSAGLTWERQPGQWVSLNGLGKYATEAALRNLARLLVDAELPVTLQIHLAPQGWRLQAFKPTVVTLADPADRRRTLSVALIDAIDPDFAHNSGAQAPAQQVTINGKPGQLIHSHGIWILQALLPDGSAFILQAPTDLTADQVLAIAAQVAKP